MRVNNAQLLLSNPLLLTFPIFSEGTKVDDPYAFTIPDTLGIDAFLAVRIFDLTCLK